MTVKQSLSSIVAVAVAMVAAGAPGRARPLVNGVASGDVDQTSAALWARTTTPGTVVFTVFDNAAMTSQIGAVSAVVTDPSQPAKAVIQGLFPGRQYYFRATDASAESATGRFRTLASTSARPALRFGVSDAIRGDMAPFAAMKNIPSLDLDFFVALGDTVYADLPSPAVPLPQAMTIADFRAKHAEVLTPRAGLNALADLRSSTPVFATIDDHEVTSAFAGWAFAPLGRFNETPLYLNGIQAFREYQPVVDAAWPTTGADPRTDGKARLSRSRMLGATAAIHILDTRSFRDTALPTVTNPFDLGQVFAFLVNAFTPGRSLLGAAPLAQLEADLLAARSANVTWQFIFTPSPMQNLGVLQGQDRWEGYAAERTALLRFLNDHNFSNVVFVSAGLYGTIVNAVQYQNGPQQPQIDVSAFDIAVGPVSYDQPFGPSLAQIAATVGYPGALPLPTYLALPADQKEAYIQQLGNALLTPLGYRPIGLSSSPIRASLQTGAYTATNTYGWTEFEVEGATGLLTVTTYGVSAYPASSDPLAIAALQPEVVSRFVVAPTPVCPGDANGDGRVNFSDLNAVLSRFGQTGPAIPGDVNNDGVVNFLDLNLTLSGFGLSC